MASDVSRDEFKNLETRVDVVEREVDGEKLVTRHVLEQTRRNGDDLAAVKSKTDTLEEKLDAVARDLGTVKGQISGLRVALPQIVGDVMRDVMRERDDRK
jgi:tetrahydromethanopterin S-methyltransferase subunit G